MLSTGPSDVATFTFGVRPLVPLIGDWNGDGIKTAGYFSGGVFRLSNSITATEPTPLQFTFGDARGFPVAGDFDGDGKDDVAVYHEGLWHIRYTATGLSPAPITFGSGVWPSTVPVAGDWNNDGIDGIGIHHKVEGGVPDPAGTWRLRNTLTAATDDAGTFVYNPGAPSYPVVGDWNADGITTVGTVAGTTWCLKNSNTVGNTCDTTFTYGATSDFPVVWMND